ncbi:MAG: HD domain-containing protein [Candidatus Omnitrophica bacterium]|nr:HD domain-containing protein [Candidatus Omnitrophota bacterium]MBU4590674.1 HD domain-containing protein [Candidatus Omnitrophota bacterium]
MKKKFDGDIYFTPKQAAEHFNLSLSTIKNYIYASKLNTLKTPGGHHRIRKSELLATLGDRVVLRGDEDKFSLMFRLCTAMLPVFKTLGPAGNSLIMHAKNVSMLSGKIARAMAMSEADIKYIEIAGLVHDIGHMAIEKHILLKSEGLTPQEYRSIKNHPIAGEEILSSIEGLKEISGVVLQHHERLDGKGYPRGFSGEKIKKAARIIAIAEAYDSMISPHSYKRSVSKEAAMSELARHSGTQFDRDIVKIFTKTI